MMQRENFMITKHHKEWLKRASKDKGVSMSEILRAAIDAYMAKEGKCLNSGGDKAKDNRQGERS